MQTCTLQRLQRDSEGAIGLDSRAARGRTRAPVRPRYDLEIPFRSEDGHSPFSARLIGTKLPERNVLGVPRAVTVIACVPCVCVRVRESLVEGVPNSEHSINTPLISQQYTLNSDELISLVMEQR